MTNIKSKSLAQNSVWSGSLTIFNIASNLAITPYLIKNLGSTSYGLLMILFSFSGILAVLDLGLGDAIIRYISGPYKKNDIKELNKYFSNSLLIYILMGFLACFAVLILSNLIIAGFNISDYYTGDASLLLSVVGITIAFTFIGQAFSAVSLSLQDFKFRTITYIAQNLIFIFGCIVCVRAHYGVLGILISNFISFLTFSALNITVAKILIPHLSIIPRYSKKHFVEIVNYVIYLLVAKSVGVIWRQIDKILLGIFISPVAVASISVAQRLCLSGGVGLLNSLGSVLFPKFSSLDSLETTSNIFIKWTWLLTTLSCTIFIPICLFADDILTLWISDEFSRKSSHILVIIGLGCILRGSFQAYEAIFKAHDKTRELAVIFFLCCVTSIALNLLLIPNYGLLGAGYSYIVSQVWDFLAIYWAWSRILKNHSFKSFILAMSVPIAVSLCLIVGVLFVRDTISISNWPVLLLSIFATSTSVLLLILLLELFVMHNNSIFKRLGFRLQ